MLAFHIFSFATNFYLLEISEHGETIKAGYKNVVFGQVTPNINILLSILSFVSLLYVQSALSNCIKKGYFNYRSASKFRYAAIFLLLAGGVGLIFDLIWFWTSKGATTFTSLGMDFYMLIIAFSLYVIADVIENGSLMRQDNELTI